MKQATAKLNYLRIAPRKVRLVADLVRGMNANKAVAILANTRKRASEPMMKLVKSAIANAKNNLEMDENKLYIAELRVDEGPTLKRWRPRAFGRAYGINKRTSHIKIILKEHVTQSRSKRIQTEKNK